METYKHYENVAIKLCLMIRRETKSTELGCEGILTGDTRSHQ